MKRFARLAPAFIVTITALFVLPHEAGGYRLAKWGAFGFALAAAAALLAFPGPHKWPRGFWALGAFVLSAVTLPLLSSSLSPAHWPTALGMLSGLALFFVTVIALGDDEHARRVNLVLLTAGGVSCAAVVLLQAAGLRWFTSDVYTGLEFRAPGTFGNPNWAAAFLAPLVPVAFGLAAAAQRRWPYLAASGVLSIATLATLSKGGAVALISGVLVYYALGVGASRDATLAVAGGSGKWLALRVRWLAFSAAVSVGVVSLAITWPALAQVSWMRGRVFLWRAALWLVGEHPLTGVGLGGYPAAYGRAAAALVDGDPAAFQPLSSVDFAHHDVLQFAAEGGVVTAVAFVVVVASALSRAQRRRDPLSRAVGAAVATIFVAGLSDSALRIPATFVLFFVLLGWLSPVAVSVRLRPALRPLLGLIALLGVLQGVRFSVGNAAWTRGRDALAASLPAVAELERARYWLPEHGRSASQLTRALAHAGKLDEALAASARAASLRFDFDDEIFRRDLQSRSLPRHTAIRQWQELSQRFPVLVTPHLRLGALHLRGNDRAAAITAYETALANPQPTPRAEAARAEARRVLRLLGAKPLTRP